MKKAQQNLTETDPQHIHETFSHNQDPKQTTCCANLLNLTLEVESKRLPTVVYGFYGVLLNILKYGLFCDLALLVLKKSRSAVDGQTVQECEASSELNQLLLR